MRIPVPTMTAVILGQLGILVSVACGAAQPVSEPTAATPPASSSVVASATAASSPTPSTLYIFAPEPGSTVGGSVKVDATAAGAMLTATVSGLKPGHAYLADADPLPCELFTGGPSQSFPKQFRAGGDGRATVQWTVPSAMAGNANIQILLR